MTVGERLVSYWKGQPIGVRPPVNQKNVKDFEKTFSVRLPEDVLDFYEHADGFDQIFDMENSKYYYDRNGFNFYPLSKVAPVDSIENGAFSFPGSSTYFAFADYLDWSWGYALRLGAGSSRVVIVGERDKQVHVADTFEEFVGLYIANDDAIYGG